MSDSQLERYDIAFAGECLDGHALADVRAGVAKLFKADESTLNRLFSGKSQRIKRNCDKVTALKYQKAMNAIGARVTISAAPVTAAQAQQATETPAEGGAPNHPVSAPADDRATAEAPSALALAPAGTEVLRPDERQSSQTAAIDTTHLSVADMGTALSDPAPPPPAVPVPDFDVADVGAILDDQAPTRAQIAADERAKHDLSALELAPAEHDLSDCVAPTPAAPELSLDHLSVEDAGSDLLKSDERIAQSINAPDTSHLSVKQD